MSRAPLSSHDRAAVLQKGRRIAAELAGAACDPASSLRMADRLALVALALAVGAEVSRMAGVECLPGDACAMIADSLARIEAGAG